MSEGNGNGTASPQKHAPDASPVNGQVPPVEHRWQPGVSANPGGLPKGTKKVKRRLRNALIKRLRGDPAQIEAIVDGLIGGCAEGDSGCQRIAWDRLDGVLEKKIDIRARAIVKVLVRGDTDSP